MWKHWCFQPGKGPSRLWKLRLLIICNSNLNIGGSRLQERSAVAGRRELGLWPLHSPPPGDQQLRLFRCPTHGFILSVVFRRQGGQHVSQESGFCPQGDWQKENVFVCFEFLNMWSFATLFRFYHIFMLGHQQAVRVGVRQVWGGAQSQGRGQGLQARELAQDWQVVPYRSTQEAQGA